MAIIKGSRNAVSGSARKGFAVEGIEHIVASLGKILNAATGKEIKDVLMDAGTVLRDEAKRLAPYDPKRTKGTHLRDAIFAGRGSEDKSDVLVGVNYKKAPHAHLVEYGTVKMAAQPYMRPAISASGPRVSEIIKTGLIGVIEKNAK